MCIVAYLRQCVENKGSVSTWLCCFAALLHFFLFFFWRFFFPFHSLVVRTRMSHHRQAPERGAEKKNPLCSKPAEVVIDGMLNKNKGRKEHFLPTFGRQKPLSRWRKSVSQLARCFLFNFFIYSFRQWRLVISYMRASLESIVLNLVV